MGREVRRVPKDWQHPKKKTYDYRTGREVEVYQPMYDRPFAAEMDEWYAAWKAWENGTDPDRAEHDMPYWEWNGGPPDPLYYRPDWPNEYESLQANRDGSTEDQADLHSTPSRACHVLLCPDLFRSPTPSRLRTIRPFRPRRACRT